MLSYLNLQISSEISKKARNLSVVFRDFGRKISTEMKQTDLSFQFI